MKFEILMSTYNGEKYLSEQIDSILSQVDIDVHITIRDDGSSDNTIDILKQYQAEYPDLITVYCKDNVGYAKSFIELLSLAIPDADYYAFSDQDDIWLSEKCFMASKKLEECKDEFKLYVSAVKNCDAELNLISVNQFNKNANSLKSDFARHRFPGCVMAFNSTIKDTALKMINNYGSILRMPSHDFIISSIAYLYGIVIVDDNSYILHRRHSLSVTSKNKGIFSRIKTEYNIVIKNKDENYLLAKMLFKDIKNSNRNKVSNEDIRFLKCVIGYKRTLKNTFRLIFYSGFSCGIKVCDAETRFKILIRYY